jgi:hypothetical protein
MPGPRQVASKPSTDVGTIAPHWIVAIAMIASLVTGIRIAADAQVAPFSKWPAPTLPQGEAWTVHFVAGLTGAAYLLRMRRRRPART